jgi:dephospho-CoA kinase
MKQHCIGITGGIGSGKSIICRVLEAMDYPVFYTDIIAKKNMIEHAELISAIVKSFGKEAYIENKLNKAYISREIFSKPELKEKLNSLVHPTVYESLEIWKKEQHSSLVFVESALMFETESYKKYDDVWLVVADEETKIERVMQRDKLTRDEVIQRMNNQLSDEQKMKFSCKLIHNSATDQVLPQVLNLLHLYN